jgi:hypothetical protein
MNSHAKDPYLLNKAALRPLLPGADNDSLLKSSHACDFVGETAFLNFLGHHGLSAFWHEKLSNPDNVSLFSQHFKEKLHQSRLVATCLYLRQKAALQQIKALLDEANIPHATFKGAHTRELLYEDPACRAACDIDILIAKSHITDAAIILQQAGYTANLLPENISHEATFSDRHIHIDLHWDVMRTGRTRVPISEHLLDNRVERPTHWALSNEGNLYVMLTHPVFTKYATSRNSTLNRVLDTIRWINQREINWDEVDSLLETTGNRTAAWIMLLWLDEITNNAINASFSARIQPGTLRQKYLRHWIKKNYSDRMLAHPKLIQLLFTLTAHDTLQDARRAIVCALSEKNSSSRKTKALMAALQPAS